MVVQLALLPQAGPGFDSLEPFCVEYSSFLPQSKDMHIRLIGDSKLSLFVSVRVCECKYAACIPASRLITAAIDSSTLTRTKQQDELLNI